jgi:MFS family permease
LTTLPIALALVVCSPLSGLLVGAGHARLAIVVAGVAISCGALILTGLQNDTPLPVLVAAYAIFGVGLGSISAPVNTTAVSGMPRTQAGLAAAVASTSRQVGASFGVALAGSLAGGGIELAHRADLAESTHPMFWVIVAFGVGIVVLGILSTGTRARASASRVASLLEAPQIVARRRATTPGCAPRWARRRLEEVRPTRPAPRSASRFDSGRLIR